MPQSLLTNQTPEVGNASDATPGITRGVSLQFAENGQITHVRWWSPTSNGGTYTVGIWRVTAADPSGAGTLLASKVHSGTPTGDAWNLTALDTPVAVSASSALYRIGVHNDQGRYVASNSFFVSPLVNGQITAEADGTNPVGLGTMRQGTFQISASLAYPQNTGSAANYFVDVVFVPDSEGGDVSGSGALTFSPLQLIADGTPDPDLSGTLTLPALDLSGTAAAEQDVLPQEGTAYEIGEIMDALAGTFNGVTTGDRLAGVAQSISCQAEVPGQVSVPAVVLEIDDLDWDLNMGAGADGFTVLATVLVQLQDLAGAQRELWRFLSRRNTSGVARLKAALETNKTLNGLVSYAIFSRVRSIGTIKYNAVDYLGAELIIEIVS
jgi:hypothetical protein